MRKQTVIATVAALLLFSACGADSATPDAAKATSTTAPAATTETTVSESPESTDQPSTETSQPSTADEPDPAESELVARADLSGGELTVDSRRVEATVGDTIVIEVTSDEAEHVHVHGYDLIVDVQPDRPAQLSFVADSAGSFEVELEDSGRFLFDLVVR